MKAMKIDTDILESLCNIENSFHFNVDAFTKLERKHDEIGKIKLGREERRLWDYIVRIIVLMKRWLLRIESGFCMGTNGKNNLFIKTIGNKAFSRPFGRNTGKIFIRHLT